MGHKKSIVILLTALLIAGCASTQIVEEYVPQELAIHDVVFCDYQPESYDDVKPVSNTNFIIGDSKFLVIRFGGLDIDEENNIVWAVAIEVYLEGSFITALGPEYFTRDLDIYEAERDKYLVILSFEMYPELRTGNYEFNVMIMDASNYESVMKSIMFTVSQGI